MQENTESIKNEKQFALCSVGAAPVRRDAAHRSEMVNQLVYGEAIEVLDEKDEWRYIRSLFDSYEGWVTFHLISNVTEAVSAANDFIFTTKLITEWENNSGEKLHLPMGAFLREPQQTIMLTNSAARKLAYPEGLVKTAEEWLHVPYLWGGKTAMGVDCSGFVQTVFKVHNIFLKRDAWQQAEQGCIVSLLESKPGDIAFFNNDAGRITHVGILLGSNQIIHAAGKVRVDFIDEKGIQNRELKKQTHQLHSVRRVSL